MVFRFDESLVVEALHAIENDKKQNQSDAAKNGTEKSVSSERNDKFVPTLEVLQEIHTVPIAFPKNANTCGRIAVDPSGKWVLVSNRGHDSIAVYQVRFEGEIGQLRNVGYYHTAGHTPRHFKFSKSGRWIFAANQVQ